MNRNVIMNDTKKIAILLATYNGEKYIAEQIHSLLTQTMQGWTLYVHDDGSTDGTVKILEEFRLQYPQIKILDYPSQGGAKDNFLSLVDRVEADYYFFCDQDDVWFPQKVQLTMERMTYLEQSNQGKPIVVHSDLIVTDDELNVIHESFLQYSGIHPEFLTTFNQAPVSGLTTGCTMCFNSKAKLSILHPYTDALMHDYWVTLCTLRCGGIVSLINSPLLYYRQHGSNTLGAKDRAQLTITSRIHNIRRIVANHYKRSKMLKALHYGSYFKFILYKLLYKYRILTAKK